MRRLATSTATVVLLTACSSPGGYSLTQAPPKAGAPPPPLSSTAAAFTVTGQVEVPAETPGRAGSSPCLPDNDPYDELGRGAAVTVLDPGGQAIALDRLGQGVYLDVGGRRTQSVRCGFRFRLDLPEGEQSYDVEVGSRVPVRYTRDELDQKLSLSPGDF
jgi:hypothetical protein